MCYAGCLDEYHYRVFGADMFDKMIFYLMNCSSNLRSSTPKKADTWLIVIHLEHLYSFWYLVRSFQLSICTPAKKCNHATSTFVDHTRKPNSPVVKVLWKAAPCPVSKLKRLWNIQKQTNRTFHQKSSSALCTMWLMPAQITEMNL